MSDMFKKLHKLIKDKGIVIVTATQPPREGTHIPIRPKHLNDVDI